MAGVEAINLRMTGSKPVALPLGLVPTYIYILLFDSLE